MIHKKTDDIKKDALSIFLSGVKAVEAGEAVRRNLTRKGETLKCSCRKEAPYDLSVFNHIYVVGAGKATASMAAAVEDIMGEYITDGVINVKYGHTTRLGKIRLNEAGHPIPDANGEKGAREIAEMVTRAGEGDLVINLISGGGSALMPIPAEGLSLSDKQSATDLLLASGASIHEVNSVRKHLSAVKGGGLARMAYPAQMLTLIISDVTGDDLSAIASGPSAPDESTFEEALSILKRYALLDRVRPSVKDHLLKGLSGKVHETARAGDPCFSRVMNCMVATNAKAVEQAVQKAVDAGYEPLVMTTTLEGEAREVAKVITSIAREVQRSGRPVKGPACLLFGGETTVTIKGDGKGGRNQELALAAALALDGTQGIVLLSGGTDGTDGPTDAAGAVVDGTTRAAAADMSLDAELFLKNNDAYTFFSRCGGLIKTGPTNTNVMDLIVVLIS